MASDLSSTHSSISCSGYCRDCETDHTLQSERAIPHALRLMESLQHYQRLDFEQELIHTDPRLHTDWLYSDALGKMFGILVCNDLEGNEVILKAFSSKYNGLRVIEGWVDPLVDATLFDATIEAGNKLIHPLTLRISELEKNSTESIQLIQERKRVSKPILEKLLALYEVHNFKNERRTLKEAFDPSKKMPIGTGDCCAPKLINHAAKNGLIPISLAEFFWGKPLASGDRIEGHFYPSCSERCEPLLGFMLCGK